ncbi:hypothetical protein ABPG77_008444 [Micractinium sp. CCAP 211/92]
MSVESPRRSGGSTRLRRASQSTAEVLLAAVDTAASGFALLRSRLHRDVFIDPARLRTVRALGEGAFGRTHRAELAPEGAATPTRTITGRTRGSRDQPKPRDVAVKTLRRELLEDSETVLLFVKEVELLKTLRHRHIVELVGCSWQRSSLDSSVRSGQGGGGIKTIFFVQEYCAGGSLGELVRRQMIRPYKKLYRLAAARLYWHVCKPFFACRQGRHGPVLRRLARCPTTTTRRPLCRPLSDADALRWCLGIASALQYLHSLSPPVMHRDLKLDNIMLSSADVAQADAKLGDFGLARLAVGRERRRKEGQQAATAAAIASALLSQAGGTDSTAGGEASVRQPSNGSGSSVCDVTVLAGPPPDAVLEAPEAAARLVEPTGCTGSFGYMAPEVLRSKPYGASCDIFSLGMCMHNLFARVLPSFQIMLQGGTEQLGQYAAQVADGYRPPLPEGLPPDLAALISDCWKGEPALRPSAATVVARLEKVCDSGVLGHGAGIPRPGCCALM